MQKEINTDNGKVNASSTNRNEHGVSCKYIICYSFSHFLIPLSLLFLFAYRFLGFRDFTSFYKFLVTNAIGFVLLVLFVLALIWFYDYLMEINKINFKKFSNRSHSNPLYYIVNFIRFFMGLSIYFLSCAFVFSLIGIFDSTQLLVLTFFAVIIIRLSSYWNPKRGEEMGTILAQLVIPFGVLIFIGKYSWVKSLGLELQGHILEIWLSAVLIILIIPIEIGGSWILRKLKNLKNSLV